MYRANRFALRLANGVGHLDFLVVGAGGVEGGRGKETADGGQILR